MQRDYARTIAEWHYPAEYAFYDWSSDPADLAELLDARSWPGHYYAVIGADGTVIGFLQTIPEVDSVEIGLGLRPDLAGLGHGHDFLDACLRFATEQYAVARCTLAVAAFNRRAITVYERAGFQAIGTFTQHTNGGKYPFIKMERSHREEYDTSTQLLGR
ncbi:MAG TPA: GNAT family protein [Thermomicrobiales bacterium]|jgi:ribosomal-protein-alanine N-acetyltransferase